jgi:hypothetical protein
MGEAVVGLDLYLVVVVDYVGDWVDYEEVGSKLEMDEV